MKDVSVLFDFNNLAFRCMFVPDISINTSDPEYGLWRYLIFQNIFEVMNRVKNVKEIVLAIDDKKSWRKSYFNRYKESRKIKRDKSDLNWNEIFSVIHKFCLDLKHYLPFKVLKIKNCEADDIIAVLTMELDKFKWNVVSNDEDYIQLVDYADVYNPKNKEYRVCKNVEKFLTEKTLMGQSKDDIFNVKTPSDWGLTSETEGKRKPGFGIKSCEKIMKGDLKKWLEDGYNHKDYGYVDLEKNYKRNRVLIDFAYIPVVLRKRIVESYNNYNFPPPENILKFLEKHGMRHYLENFVSTERKLLELY